MLKVECKDNSGGTTYYGIVVGGGYDKELGTYIVVYCESRNRYYTVQEKNILMTFKNN